MQVDLAEYKAYKGLGDEKTSLDATLKIMLAGACSAIETYCSRYFDEQAYNLLLDGNGGIALAFPEWPVTALTSVSVNGVAIPSAAGSMTTPGYRFNELFVFLQGGYRFTRGYSNVGLTFTAGYSAANMPADLKQAAFMTAETRLRERDWLGFSSKSLAGETVAFTNKDLPPNAKAVLNSYRRVGVGR